MKGASFPIATVCALWSTASCRGLWAIAVCIVLLMLEMEFSILVISCFLRSSIRLGSWLSLMSNRFYWILGTISMVAWENASLFSIAATLSNWEENFLSCSSK